jgi:hypothetical protein
VCRSRRCLTWLQTVQPSPPSPISFVIVTAVLGFEPRAPGCSHLNYVPSFLLFSFILFCNRVSLNLACVGRSPPLPPGGLGLQACATVPAPSARKPPSTEGPWGWLRVARCGQESQVGLTCDSQ